MTEDHEKLLEEYAEANEAYLKQKKVSDELDEVAYKAESAKNELWDKRVEVMRKLEQSTVVIDMIREVNGWTWQRTGSRRAVSSEFKHGSRVLSKLGFMELRLPLPSQHYLVARVECSKDNPEHAVATVEAYNHRLADICRVLQRNDLTRLIKAIKVGEKNYHADRLRAIDRLGNDE